MMRLTITALLLSAVALALHASTITSGEIDTEYSQSNGADQFNFGWTSDAGYSISGQSGCCANISWPNFPAPALGATVSIDWSLDFLNPVGSVTFTDGVSYPSVYFGAPSLRFNIQPFIVTGVGMYFVPFTLTAPGTLSAYVVGTNYPPVLNDQGGVNGSGYVTFSLVQSPLFGIPSQDFFLAGGEVSFVFTDPIASAPEPSAWLTITLGFLVLALGMKRPLKIFGFVYATDFHRPSAFQSRAHRTADWQ